MKRFLVSVITIIAVLFIIGAAGAAFFVYTKYMPSSELADQNEWFGIVGDRVAILLDNNLVEDHKARYIDGEVYLPIDWVNDILNEKFYWDSTEKILVYTLPEEIIYADASVKGSGGKPLLIEQENQVWLLAGLVLNYTDVRMERFTDGDVKRIFIDTSWESASAVSAKKDGKLRVRGGIKSEILTDVKENENMQVLESMENWTKVRTVEGGNS